MNDQASKKNWNEEIMKAVSTRDLREEQCNHRKRRRRGIGQVKQR